MKRITAIFCASLSLSVGLLLVSACGNILSPSVQPEENVQRGVTITIGGNRSHIRTLYPTAEFTKYTLDFEYTDSYSDTKPSHERVELTGGQNSVVITGLIDGTWDITAIGWVTIDIDDEPDAGPLEFEAARGSEEITVTGGTAQTETIDLSAEMGTEDGYFSWDIAIPGGADIQTASLTVSRLNGPQVFDKDLVTNPTDSRGIKTLEPGYYLMRLSVFNGYQRIGHTEVLAVYSNMETTATYTFTGADFVPALKMSGTVTLTNTIGVKSIRIVARSGGPYLYTNNITVSGDGSYSWEIYTAAAGSSSEIRFAIEVYYEDNSIFIETGKTISLGSVDYPDIDLGTVSADAITIGGSIHFTGIDQEPDHINIYSNTVNNGRGYTVTLGTVSGGEADGAWSMKVPANLAGDTVEFGLLIQEAGGSYFYKILDTITMPSIDTPNVSFPTMDLSTVTWSGTIDLTLNGSFPSGGVTIQAYDANSWAHLGSGQVASDGNWSITVTPYSSTKEIEFRLNMGNQEVDLGEQSLPGTAKSGINLGSYSYITLSGTVDGNPPESSMVAAYIDDDEDKFLGGANVASDRSWSMTIDSPSSGTAVSFVVALQLAGNHTFIRLPPSYNKTVYNSDVSGIDLTGLSVTTETVTVNITSDGITPAPGLVYICDSPIGQADVNNQDLLWLKVLAASNLWDATMLSTWSLEVPMDTESMYVVVVTDSYSYYISSTAYSTATITLNLSEMTN